MTSLSSWMGHLLRRRQGSEGTRTWCCRKEKPPELERRIQANDHEGNAQYEYATNYIKTSKYNVITFLPKNLFEQFQRLANFYFLCLLILQCIPQITSLEWYYTLQPLLTVLGITAAKEAYDDIISSLTPLTTIIPLVAVLAVSAAKDAVDDFQRHRSDATVNNRRSWVLRDGKLVEERWHKVTVGDIIKMENNQFVAADLLLLSTSEPNSLCYIETAELDGETNLKVRQAIPETATMEDDLQKFASFDAEIVAEPPNNRLGKFDGMMKYKNETFSLDNDKILLRGCVLRNTKWCYGLVIFAGQETKLMMNSGQAMFKRTHLDRLLNVLVIGIFIFLASMCSICSVACGVWEAITGYNFQSYLPWEDFVSETKGTGAAAISSMVFLSYVIIFNTVVPISLYVSVEMIRLVNSFWINWDSKMFHAATDTPAKARTTTLNEELGQIEYIFSDKTGTLTQNIMTFNKCSIDGKSYGDPLDEFGNQIEITEDEIDSQTKPLRTKVTWAKELQQQKSKVDFSSNKYAEKNFEFFDGSLLENCKKKDPQVCQFFKLLALCHTVMPEVNEEGVLEYQAQSPDEGALVSAARNFGFVFKSRTPKTITIEVNGTVEVYDLLCILDFNNVRKRMSVIVKKDGKIQLLCKGADSVIYERLNEASSDLKELTTHHLNEFAQDGLRTLCLAVKDIDENTYTAWKKKHHAASTSLENRDDKVDAVYEEIEGDLTLIGATAIEDKLQDGVPNCIANLARGGIKIWVLTGDKQETAINIGYSCKLLTDEMEEIFIVDAESQIEVEKQLDSYMKEVKKIVGDRMNEDIKIANESGYYDGNDHITFSCTEETGGFALVVTGHSLAYALKPELEILFLELGCLCKAVICCRVTPLQKAQVVDLIKRNKKSITLSIGDGANDVSMIKTAHIGVGISGQEGLQAVLASDYAIAQFKYLERLLLVHGRWSYLRMSKFLKYFFYKNIAFTLCHFWFAFFCGFSAQTLFDPYFISFYNVFYTSLPVLGLGVFDQDVNEDYSIRYPKLYTPGHLDLLFNKRVFLWSICEGIISSLILFFIPYGAFASSVSPWGEDTADIQTFGVVVASILVVSVNLRCAIDTSFWTGLNHLFIWGSIVYFFCFHLALYSNAFNYQYVGVAFTVFSSATFWFTLLLTNCILILPVLAYRFYQTNIKPSLSDRVKMKQRLIKSKSKSKDLHIRRQSTMRRSTRSFRAGYAFSHQGGFGELITSGINMRQRVERDEERTKARNSEITKQQGGMKSSSSEPVQLVGVRKLNSDASSSLRKSTSNSGIS